MERNHSLDALRGCAAVCVAYSHLIAKLHARGELDPFGELLYHLTKAVFDVGKASVLILFTLSGYFILSGLNKLATRYERPVAAFLFQRFYRLYPLYWGSLVLGVAFPWDDPSRVFSPLVIAVNATMLQGFFFVDNVLGLYWTLQIEISFYLLCLALFLLGLSRSPRWVFYALLGNLTLALMLAGVRFFAEIGLPVALPLLVSACLLGALWQQRDNPELQDARAYAHHAVLAFFVFLLPICLFAYSRDAGHNESWYRYSLSYALGMAIFLLASSRRPSGLRWLAPLGGVSYLVFLLHPTVYALLELAGLTAANLAIPTTIYLALSLLVVLGVSFLIKATLVDGMFGAAERLLPRLGGRKSTPVPAVMANPAS